MKTSKIFQHGSYSTLYGGFYDGTIRLDEALKHGDCGIGTLDGADGEVIVLDGVAYHGNSENKVRVIAANETLPYIALIKHVANHQFDSKTLSSTHLTELSEAFPTKNSAYSIKITGFFSSVEISSKQAHNTEPYLDILAKQPHFTRENVTGTIVGIWSPAHLSGLYGNGFHLHFLSTDKSFGAHLVRFTAENVKVEFGEIGKIEQEFPVENSHFQTLNLEK